MNSQTLFFTILFLFNILSMFLYYLFLKSRFSQKRILAELRSEVDKLVIDLGREADRDVAILESRIENLRALIDEADRRILVAGKETARRKEELDILKNMAQGATPQAVNEAPVRRTVAVPETPPVQPAQVIAPAEPAPKSEPVQIYTRPVITRSEKQIEPFVPVQERVVDMARKGFSAEMISVTLSMPLGEIELILDMNGSSL